MERDDARTGLDGVKGTLGLQDGALVFAPAGGRSAETVLPVGKLTKDVVAVDFSMRVL